MNKTTLVSILFVFLLLSGYVPVAFGHLPTTNKDILVIDTYGEPETLDPAWCYDTSSGDIIMNVYEPLISMRRNATDLAGNWVSPYKMGKMDEFDPTIATSVPSMEAISEYDAETGLTFVMKMTFTIGSGKKFHDLTDVTADDVEYSFERMLVQDRDGGPQWMIYFPLLAVYGGPSPAKDPAFNRKIDKVVEATGNTVTFRFVQTFPQLTWLQIMSQAWSTVVKKSWAIANGDFDGDLVGHTWTDICNTLRWDATYGTWKTWHNPAESFIEGDGMMGTGPYKFTSWIHGASWQIDRFPGYWDLWPARIQSGSSERNPGYISTILWNYKPSWVERRTRFLAGDSDFSAIDRLYRDQVLNMPDVKCFYDMKTKGLALTAMFFTFNVSTATTHCGSGFNPSSPYLWGSDRIPIDLFSDLNVRKGFAYAFPYDTWLVASYLGEGFAAADPIIEGLLYDNPAQERYTYNLTEAKYYLKLAWGGGPENAGHNPETVIPGLLWSNGMQFRMLYNIGNVPRQTSAEQLTEKIKSLQPALFQLLDPLGVTWPSYLADMVASKLPLFVIGWLADYPDPDNFAFPFMHSEGTFSAWQKYKNDFVDQLIVQGATWPGTAMNGLVFMGYDDNNDGFIDENKYWDINANTIWDTGEPAIKDVNANLKYDALGPDFVLSGPTPPDQAPLSVPRFIDKYWDANLNTIADVGEPWVRDVNNNFVYDPLVDVWLVDSPPPPPLSPLRPSENRELNKDAPQSSLWDNPPYNTMPNVYGQMIIADYHLHHTHASGGQPYWEVPLKPCVFAWLDKPITHSPGFWWHVKALTGDPTMDLEMTRQIIYYELQAIYHVDTPGLPLVTALIRHWERGWIRGWYYNAINPGFPYYHLFKQGTHMGDANLDYGVDVGDRGFVSGRWSAFGYSPPGSKALVEADINGGIGATTGSLAGTESRGIPDGVANVIDLALISAYWDEAPRGPLHP